MIGSSPWYLLMISIWLQVVRIVGSHFGGSLHCSRWWAFLFLSTNSEVDSRWTSWVSGSIMLGLRLACRNVALLGCWVLWKNSLQTTGWFTWEGFRNSMADLALRLRCCLGLDRCWPLAIRGYQQRDAQPHWRCPNLWRQLAFSYVTNFRWDTGSCLVVWAKFPWAKSSGQTPSARNMVLYWADGFWMKRATHRWHLGFRFHWVWKRFPGCSEKMVRLLGQARQRSFWPPWWLSRCCLSKSLNQACMVRTFYIVGVERTIKRLVPWRLENWARSYRWWLFWWNIFHSVSLWIFAVNSIGGLVTPMLKRMISQTKNLSDSIWTTELIVGGRILDFPFWRSWLVLPNRLWRSERSTSWRGHQRKQSLRRANGIKPITFHWGQLSSGLGFSHPFQIGDLNSGGFQIRCLEDMALIQL